MRAALRRINSNFASNFGLRIADFGSSVRLPAFVPFVRVLMVDNDQSEIRNPESFTYSNSKGLPLIPAAGGAIQLAIFPGSVTGFMRLRTYSRSSMLGNHSDLRRSNSSGEIRLP